MLTCGVNKYMITKCEKLSKDEKEEILSENLHRALSKKKFTFGNF